MELNKEQKMVSSLVDGYHLVKAGPGSGKTFTLIERARELLKITPRVCIITFTREAAGEIKDRLEINGQSSCHISTIHSLAFTVVREYYYGTQYKMPEVLTEYERATIIRKIVEEIGADELPENPHGALQKLRLTMEQLPGWIHEYSMKYMLEKAKLEKIDFTDLLELGIQILERDSWSRVFDHILVDEAQDNSPLVNRFIHGLQQLSSSLMFIGDPNQSIYLFSGASKDCFSKFTTRYPGSTIHHLSQQYRMPDINTEITNKVAGTSMQKMDKEGNLELLGHYDNIMEEAVAVGQRLLRDKEWDQTMVLARTNNQLFTIQDICMQLEIPYTCKLGFLDRTEVLDIMNYLMVSARDYDDTNPERLFSRFRRIANKDITYNSDGPRQYRYMSRSLLSKIEEEYYKKKSLVSSLMDPTSWGKEFWKEKVTKRIVYQLEQIRGADTPVGAIKAARNYTYQGKNYGYDKYWELESKKKMEPDLDIHEHLNLLEQMASQYGSLEGFLGYVSRFTKNRNKKEGVQLRTIHGAKGKESKNIYLIGLTEDILPHVFGEIEEEKNIFYVAMSRAIESTMVSSHKKPWTMERSRYYDYLVE